jgi:hypothetical protein
MGGKSGRKRLIVLQHKKVLPNDMVQVGLVNLLNKTFWGLTFPTPDNLVPYTFIGVILEIRTITIDTTCAVTSITTPILMRINAEGNSFRGTYGRHSRARRLNSAWIHRAKSIWMDTPERIEPPEKSPFGEIDV